MKHIEYTELEQEKFARIKAQSQLLQQQIRQLENEQGILASKIIERIKLPKKATLDESKLQWTIDALIVPDEAIKKD